MGVRIRKRGGKWSVFVNHHGAVRATRQDATPGQPELMSEEEMPLEVADSNGDPGGSRTPNPQIRSLMLYPVELRGQHFGTFVGNQPNMVGPERFELPT